MKEDMILEQLKREALYAQCSFSTELLYETYGKAKMARQLGAITQSGFMEINYMTVYFMNTDKEYIRHCNEKFRRGQSLSLREKEGIVRNSRNIRKEDEAE